MPQPAEAPQRTEASRPSDSEWSDTDPAINLEHVFEGQQSVVIATGGFARLFEREALFDAVVHDLVLLGLERALSLNRAAGASKSSTAADAAT